MMKGDVFHDVARNDDCLFVERKGFRCVDSTALFIFHIWPIRECKCHHLGISTEINLIPT